MATGPPVIGPTSEKGSRLIRSVPRTSVVSIGRLNLIAASSPAWVWSASVVFPVS